MRGGAEARAARLALLRVGAIGLGLALGLAAVLGRAFQLQVLEREALAGQARDQYIRQVVLKPRRGVVTDRSGVRLAQSADAESVYADPELFERSADRPRAVQQLAAALGQEPRAILRKLSRGGRFAWLERRVTPREAAAVRAVLKAGGVEGVGLVKEARRHWPKGEVAGAVLGLVGDDGQGLEGVELALDDLLRGAPARVPSLRDGAGRMLLHEAPGPGEEREGARVELTLEQGLQVATERALARAATASRAASATAVALDPATGEILALANWPPFDPNAPRRAAGAARNRAAVDAWEPGSTMKVFSIAGALDRRAVAPLDAIDCGNGSWRLGAHTIRDTHPLGWTGPGKVVALSSNVGAAKIGQRLGREGLHASLRAFGFGERPGTGLPGEARGALPPPRSEIALATQSFGYGLTASPLQVTAAMAAIANGGVLLRPRIVKRVTDPATGELLDAARVEVVRQAVSARTAETMKAWLAGAIEDPHGTGRRARLESWRAGGKTGTAEKIDPVSGGYSEDRHFSSFVGFAPLDAPRIVVGVFVDEPKEETFGGEVAAPVFKEVAEYALNMWGVPPDAPAVAAAVAREPAPAATAAREAEPELAPLPALEIGAAPVPGSRVAVPALAGLPARSALRRLEAFDLGADLRGHGRVISQSPPPGRAVERGTRVRITLAPPG